MCYSFLKNSVLSKKSREYAAYTPYPFHYIPDYFWTSNTLAANLYVLLFLLFITKMYILFNHLRYSIHSSDQFLWFRVRWTRASLYPFENFGKWRILRKSRNELASSCWWNMNIGIGMFASTETGGTDNEFWAEINFKISRS